MTQVVGPELRLKTVCRLAEGACHHAGVCNHKVERLPRGVKTLGAGAHASKRSEVKFDELKPAAIGGLAANTCGRRISLVEVPSRPNNLRSVRGQSAGGLDA